MNWIERTLNRELDARRTERAAREERKREEKERERIRQQEEERKVFIGVGVALVGGFLVLGVLCLFDALEEHTPDLVVPAMFGLAALIAVAAVAIVALVLNYKARIKEAEAAKLKAENAERILNTPLETFGDGELDDLEAKYAAPAGAQQPGSDTPANSQQRSSVTPTQRCPFCAEPLLSPDQQFCASCGAKLHKKSRPRRKSKSYVDV